MKTVSEFKRALKPGVMMGTIYHQKKFIGRNEKGVPMYEAEEQKPAPVTIVQSTQFAIERTMADGTKRDSWCKFPKASECKFEGGRVTILDEDHRTGSDTKGQLIPILTYWIEAN